MKLCCFAHLSAHLTVTANSYCASPVMADAAGTPDCSLGRISAEENLAYSREAVVDRKQDQTGQTVPFGGGLAIFWLFVGEDVIW